MTLSHRCQFSDMLWRCSTESAKNVLVARISQSPALCRTDQQLHRRRILVSLALLISGRRLVLNRSGLKRIQRHPNVSYVLQRMLWLSRNWPRRPVTCPPSSNFLEWQLCSWSLLHNFRRNSPTMCIDDSLLSQRPPVALGCVSSYREHQRMSPLFGEPTDKVKYHILSPLRRFLCVQRSPLHPHQYLCRRRRLLVPAPLSY